MSRALAWPAAAALTATLLTGAPATAAARQAAPPTVAALRAAPGCPTPPAAVRPVAAVPWPQQRYAPERLASLTTGTGVTVAVVDSGVDREHPQLDGRVLDGTDLLDAGGDGTRDCAGHGTGVASIIAATSRPGVAFRGLAPGARILPVRVSEQQVVDGRESGRTVSAAEFARAIRWAVDHGADVLNLSVVLYVDSPAVRSAVAYAHARDVVVVAAAGNLHEAATPRRTRPRTTGCSASAPSPRTGRVPRSRRPARTSISSPRAARCSWRHPATGTAVPRGPATRRRSSPPPRPCCARTTPT